MAFYNMSTPHPFLSRTLLALASSALLSSALTASSASAQLSKSPQKPLDLLVGETKPHLAGGASANIRDPFGPDADTAFVDLLMPKDKDIIDYVHNGICPIIRMEAVSKHKTPAQMRSIAEKVKQIMQRYGLTNLQILQEGNSYPAVYGEVKSNDPYAPTALVGGHYDAQTSNPKNWRNTQPHQPKTILEKILEEDKGKGEGNGKEKEEAKKGGKNEDKVERRLYGRGSSDDWGQVMTHIAAVHSYVKNKVPLPINIKFLIEGGEEQGSTDMDQLLEKYKSLLAADVVMITDSAPGREGHPIITTSARGLVAAYVTVQTGKNSPHSGFNLAINAQEKLARLLTSMEDEQGRVLIPRFYDKVRKLSPEEKQKLQALPFDVELFQRNYGLEKIVTAPGSSVQETMWAQPSFEVHNFGGGEEGNNIPTMARAYVTMRIVPDQQPAQVFAQFKEFLLRQAEKLGIKKYLKVETEALAFPFSTKTTHSYFYAAEKAMEEAFGASVDYMGIGATEPIAVYYQQILEPKAIIFNAYNSPRDNYHGDNESFSIDKGFIPGIKANLLFYQYVGNMGRRVE